MRVDIRLKGATEAEVRAAKALVETILGAKLRSPQEGRNPKYDGNQSWFSYGFLDFSEGVAQTRLPEPSVKVVKPRKRGKQ